MLPCQCHWVAELSSGPEAENWVPQGLPSLLNPKYVTYLKDHRFYQVNTAFIADPSFLFHLSHYQQTVSPCPKLKPDSIIPYCQLYTCLEDGILALPGSSKSPLVVWHPLAVVSFLQCLLVLSVFQLHQTAGSPWIFCSVLFILLWLTKHLNGLNPCILIIFSTERPSVCQVRVRVWTQSFNCAQLFGLCLTPWAVTQQDPLSRKFSRQENYSRLPLLPAGDLSNPGMEPESPALASGFFFFFLLSHLRSPWTILYLGNKTNPLNVKPSRRSPWNKDKIN